MTWPDGYFLAGISYSQHAAPIPSPSNPRLFKSVPGPMLRLPASHSAITSTQTSSTNGFACKRRTARRCNLHLFHSPCRWPEQMRKLHRPISVLKSSTRVAPSKLIGQLKTPPLARPFFETFCDDSHRLHLARHSSGVLVAVIVASAWRSSVGWIATPA